MINKLENERLYKNKKEISSGPMIRDDTYIKMNKKQKELIIKKIEKILSSYGIKNYLFFGSFVNRNWFRDIDIVIFDKISERKVVEIAVKIESKIGIEVDIKRYVELPSPIKFSAITTGIGKIDDKTKASCMNFARVYMDFQEWFRVRNRL